MARTQEQVIAFGKVAQADISTANLLGGIWRMLKLNASLATPRRIVESDAEELGKGHEFATALYKSHVESTGHTIEGYMSSEMAAWLWAFGLGTVVESPANTYTITPLDPVTDGEELPYFSFLETIRQGASDILDHMLVGCALRSFRITINNSPGRSSSKFVATFDHSGKETTPSGIVIPAATAVNLLPAYSAAITIIGVDYVTLKTIIDLEMGWENNFRPGWYPGSGQDTGFQIQGRFEVGNRAPSFRFKARFIDGSAEITKVLALTTGTAVINLTLDASNSMIVTWQKMGFESAIVEDADGVVAVEVTGRPLFHSTNGLVSVVVKTPIAGIGQ